ncbi:hypothetical protein ANN_11825 [Periplaneta americana]|uniref:Uncharacterized protein n=1 Tax=Periplaneta americana TaxID=6978 RepID=A0ABQ8T7K3_PERAM|nr:hypothetical protein ANN_11825 [Periplaneta americana]
MAAEVEEQFESALKTIMKATETNGYLKQDMQDEIHKAVSRIKICFASLKDMLNDNIKGNSTPQGEVKEQQTHTSHKIEERSVVGQVAPSIGETHETTSTNQHVTPGGPELNLIDTQEPSKIKEDSRGNLSDNQSLDKPTDQTEKTCKNTEIEKRISEQVNHQIQIAIENLSNNIKKMIRDEIKNATQQGPEPQTPTAIQLEASFEAERNNMERDEDNEGFTRVQGRRRRERQTQEGNTESEEIDSSPTTENTWK